jgi:hypothetical protein
MKTSLLGWHRTWIYCKNNEPRLPSFMCWLPEYQGTWLEELAPIELPHVAALTIKINALKERGLTRVYIDAHWLDRHVIPLKEQVHPGWEYSRTQNPTQETTVKITLDHLMKLLEEMFQNLSSWQTHV